MASLPASVLPLDADQNEKLRAAVLGLTAEQLTWVSGYAAGLAAAGVPLASADPATAAANSEALTILFGSQTGNGEGVAAELAKKLDGLGFASRVLSLADYKPANLKREKLVAFVVSTQGEGDPPDDAELFHEYLLSERAPTLEGLRYTVLALGDSSYVHFCKTGREIDRRFEALGASRFHELVECDLDYEAPAGRWTEGIAAALPELLEKNPASPRLRAIETTSPYDKNRPFPAEVLVNQKITGASSSKDVRHIELSLEGSGLGYEPGDSLAVVVENPPQLVAELLAVLQLESKESVSIHDRQFELADALRECLEITTLNLGFLREWAGFAKVAELDELLNSEDTEALSAFVESHQIVDVIRQYPARVGAQQFVDTLRALSPRSYSIASSLTANPGEVHLTVAAVRYRAFGSEHWGAASTHLADRVSEGDTVRVFVERNSRFRLPAPDVPIIMIGPGTGVAPFRAFVEERVERNASGPNWLFFGDRNFSDDFLYQLEWQRHLKQGGLTRLDVAFSRDQRGKVYVQDRIAENGAEVYRWIENGAVLYVCGDAKRMAGDVHAALVAVLQHHGDLDRDAAERRLKALKADGRYQRDVY